MVNVERIECKFPFVSIIILNYNGKHFLEKCLTSVKLNDYPEWNYEVIMVDNGSTDGSTAYVKSDFPWVKTVELTENLGFGAGNNEAIKFAKGQFLVFLNNDTQVTKEWLSKLVDASITHSAPICASKTLLMANHELIDYDGAKFTFNGRGLGDFGRQNNQQTTCFPTGYPCAASMLIHKSLFLELDGFDEDYFACLDDTDLGWRAWLFGHQVLFCPASVVYHKVGGTGGSRFTPLKTFHSTKGALINIFKNFQLRNLFFATSLALAYDSIEFFLLVRERRFRSIMNKVRAYPWFFRHLSRILQKRAQVQKKRVVSDHCLANLGLFHTPIAAFREYRRVYRTSTGWS